MEVVFYSWMGSRLGMFVQNRGSLGVLWLVLVTDTVKKCSTTWWACDAA